MLDHVKSWLTNVSQLVHSTNKVNIFCSCWVYTCRRVCPEILWFSLLNTLYVVLEHGCELWPKCHTHSIMVEVQDWNLISPLHQDLELVIQLYAEKDSNQVDSTPVAGTWWCSWASCFLNSLGQSPSLCGWRIVLWKPLQVLIDDLGENLVEDSRYLHHFEIKEL